VCNFEYLLKHIFHVFFAQGGGIVKGPLMLELGVCPEVAAATSATMIMFTAGSVSAAAVRMLPPPC
jgi:uncharacterized membrane protein YfcA